MRSTGSRPRTCGAGFGICSAAVVQPSQRNQRTSRNSCTRSSDSVAFYTPVGTDSVSTESLSSLWWRQPASGPASIEFNKHLIRLLADDGYTLLDIGSPAGRTGASKWYQAELDVLRELGVPALRPE